MVNHDEMFSKFEAHLTSSQYLNFGFGHIVHCIVLCSRLVFTFYSRMLQTPREDGLQDMKNS